MAEEGHIGLSNEKKEETTSENFRVALSFLKRDRYLGYFVIHAYSNTYDLSPYLQRSNVGRTSRWKGNFLEKIGFTHFQECNILGGECYFKVIHSIELDRTNVSFLERIKENEIVYGRFRKFASQIGDIYKKMREVDQMLTDVGFALPREELELAPIDVGKETVQKVYPKGYVYDFYKDMLDILKEAKNEVIITDNWVDEELINLYLEKIPENVKIRLLTKKPQGNFIPVAKKFKAKPTVDFEARTSNDWHDRWVFVDNECWVTGQSVRDAGLKPTYLVKLNGYDVLKSCFDEAWKKAAAIV
jgi:hypothetical protein